MKSVRAASLVIQKSIAGEKAEAKAIAKAKAPAC